ncbi:MAG: hypothetical protein IT486_08410 [Gammaproteobacteria bacterium]|nr:hypothetical protein [Gammaproteobacteria bacterium]
MTRELRLAAYSTVAVAVLVILLDQYARWPSQIEPPPIDLPAGTRTAILLFHGSEGRDEPTLAALDQRSRELTAGMSAVSVVRYGWAPYSDAQFRAGAFGARVGEALGQELAGIGTLKAVHVIAHSTGAYIAAPLCEALKAAGRPVRVDITYLDPVGLRGILQPGWGEAVFARCGDYVEAYINADDPAPASSLPLQQAWTVDVTRAPGKDAFEAGGHRWPVKYFLDHATVDDILPGRHSHEQRARGVVEVRQAP